MPTSNFQPVRLLDPDCCYKFTYLMANSADPDQLASSKANWSRSTLFARTRHVVFSKRRVNYDQSYKFDPLIPADQCRYTADSRYLDLAYLEVKIWSLPKHENLTTRKKYCGKEEKLLLRSNFSSFPQYFQYISNFKSPIRHIFLKCG